VISLAMELLDQYENHLTLAANSLFEQILHPSDLLEVNVPPLFGGLPCLSFFGIVDAMTCLLETGGYDASQGDSTGITPLAWAVRGGQGGAVRQEAVNPDKPDYCGNTPLSWAAMKGHEQ